MGGCIGLTYDENEHASVASVWIWCSHADEVTDCDGNTAADDKCSTLPESVGEVDLDCEGDGTEDVNWNGHVVDLQIGISGPY